MDEEAAIADVNIYRVCVRVDLISSGAPRSPLPIRGWRPCLVSWKARIAAVEREGHLHGGVLTHRLALAEQRALIGDDAVLSLRAQREEAQREEAQRGERDD